MRKKFDIHSARSGMIFSKLTNKLTGIYWILIIISFYINQPISMIIIISYAFLLITLSTIDIKLLKLYNKWEKEEYRWNLKTHLKVFKILKFRVHTRKSIVDKLITNNQIQLVNGEYRTIPKSNELKLFPNIRPTEDIYWLSLQNELSELTIKHKRLYGK